MLRVNPVTPSPDPSCRGAAIRGLGMLSVLGCGLSAHSAPAGGSSGGLRPLAGLLGPDSPHANLLAGWIEPREMLCHRKWAPASMAALEVARQAVEAAGWSDQDLGDAALVLASSRGSAAWPDPWPGRRPIPLMAASNSMHAEPATAVGIEFGIRGPCHVLATGCSAGLDAAGLAMCMLATGIAPRALVIAVDLPLTPSLLDAYASSGILSQNNVNDPYSPDSTGMLPSEAAVALAIDSGPPADHPSIIAHHSNSDAWRPTGVPPDGAMMVALINKAVATIGQPAALCPHASGTKALAGSEPTALRAAFTEPPPLVILKPLIGHAVAAGGLLEAAMVAAQLKHGRLPASAPGLTPPAGIPILESTTSSNGPVIKLASGLGGHNSLLAIAPPGSS